MVLMPLLRSSVRLASGQRPHARDLDQILAYLRGRREQGLPIVSPRLASLLSGRSQGDAVRRADRLQALKLRRTMEYNYRYIPYYREVMDSRRLTPADFHTASDLSKLPVLRRQQLREHEHALLSVYPGLVPVTFSETSGTSGERLSTYVSSGEFHYYTRGEAILGLVSGLLGPQEIFQTHLDPDSDIELLIMSYAARLAGTLVVGFRNYGTLDDHIESIFRERHIPGKKARVSRLYANPSHMRALTMRAEQMGYDLAHSGLEVISSGSAMVSEDLKQLVLDKWGIRLSEGYGLSESLTTLAMQCPQSDRLHLPDSLICTEALDPATEEPVAPGQPGVLVVTEFYPDREMRPLLRYWTDDLVTLSPDRTCVCGSTTTQILDIHGRADRLVIVGGQNFYPQVVGDSLLAFPELVRPPRFQLHMEVIEDTPRAVLDAELAMELTPQERDALSQRIVNGIVLSGYLDIRLGIVHLVVNLVPPGSLAQPFPYKYDPLAVAQGVPRARPSP